VNSTEPQQSSGRVARSTRRPYWSSAATYHAGASLDSPHRGQPHDRPPSVHRACGLMYARQREQRRGPSGPKSTHATGASPIHVRGCARGVTATARGSLLSFSTSLLHGTYASVARIARGLALPESSTT
jgi:hypothetical protein